MQSEEGLCLGDEFKVELGVVKMEKGAGGGRRRMTNVGEDRVDKRSIVAINNDDYLCLARSIAVGMANCVLV